MFWIRIESGSKQAKTNPQEAEKVKNFHVLNCWMFSLRAGGFFFCSLEVLPRKLFWAIFVKNLTGFFSIFEEHKP
jgi:hypothetical protein